MSKLTETLKQKAFASLDKGSKRLCADENEIQELCESFAKVSVGEYTLLVEKNSAAYEMLLACQESIEEIEEACDYEGHSCTIIELARLGSYGPSFSAIQKAKTLAVFVHLEQPTQMKSQLFKINNNLIIDVCLAHEEAEINNFENLKYSLDVNQKAIQKFHNTFLTLKKEIEYSEVQIIVDRALTYIESKGF